MTVHKARLLRSGSAAAVAVAYGAASIAAARAARLAQQRGETLTVTIPNVRAGEIYTVTGVAPCPPAPPLIPKTPGQRGYSRNRYL